MPVLSYTLHAAILGWLKGVTMPSAPATLQVGLLTAAPNPDGTGVSEPSGGSGYAREDVTFGSVTTDTGISTIKNSAPVVFGPASTNPWTPVIYMGVFNGDDDSLLAYGPLAAQRTAPVGDTISFGVDAIQIRLK